MTRKGSERDTQIRQTSLNAMAKKKQKVEEELLTQGSRSAPNNKQKWKRVSAKGDDYGRQGVQPLETSMKKEKKKWESCTWSARIRRWNDLGNNNATTTVK